MVEFPIYRSAEHRENAPQGKCACVGCALSAGMTKFSSWADLCRARGAGEPDASRFVGRLSITELYLTRGNSPLKASEKAALAGAMMISEETAKEILEAARTAGEQGIQVHEGHPSPMRQLGQHYCHALLSAGGGRLRFRCIANFKKRAKEPVLCIDAWDDWFPAAGISAAAIVDNDVVARWNEALPLAEMESFCASRATARGPILRTWTFYHSATMISLMPHKGSVPVCYAMTRPMVLLPHE